jgi:alpha-galactosidase
VLGEMTKYRRTIADRCAPDENLPTIFNEYMHLSWDCPTEENTRRIAPTVAKLGVKYYVIDCGWHNEEDGKTVYPYVGQWKESKARFPHGVRVTTDYIRSLGMRAGLWIEPEIVGKDCAEMLSYYEDECFIRRNGKKVCVMGRYFLDFRNAKVVKYMSDTIRRMAEDYGADYIKMDYNEDVGIGTDVMSDSFGEGLEQCAAAYLAWTDEMRVRFPQTLFETCSSGGMRMDYRTLAHFSVVSTSDQTHYDKYPYIAGNVLSAVLPEQAAVWSYPVGSDYVINGVFTPDKQWIADNVGDEQVVMNMVNSFLGRMHLASHLEMLTERQLAFVKEGIEYFDALSAVKKAALPCLPSGFTQFEAPCVASGFTVGDKLYLAVWNLSDNDLKRKIEVGRQYTSAICAYPQNNKLAFELFDGTLTVHFTQKNQARFFELKK